MESYRYTPEQGQLCQTYKGYDAVFPLTDCPESLVSYPLIEGEIIIITKVVYHENISCFYDNRLYYTYFYEQVIAYDFNEDGSVVEIENKLSTFNFPWVTCER